MEYAAKRCSPSPARIQQISEEQRASCAATRHEVRSPTASSPSHARLRRPGVAAGRCLCLRLAVARPNNQQLAFARVADIDQSKVWPAGTCLGNMPPPTSRSTPVDCAAPHAMEVSGTVNLAERFDRALPS